MTPAGGNRRVSLTPPEGFKFEVMAWRSLARPPSLAKPLTTGPNSTETMLYEAWRALFFSPNCCQWLFRPMNSTATIARRLDFDLKPSRIDSRPQEVFFANCCADKARRLLDYQPKVKLEEGLAVMVDWIKSRGPRPFLRSQPFATYAPGLSQQKGRRHSSQNDLIRPGSS